MPTPADHLMPGARTVADVIADLSRYDPDLPVVVSGDAEGFDYHRYAEAGDSAFDPRDDEAVHPDDVGDGVGLATVVVIWPV